MSPRYVTSDEHGKQTLTVADLIARLGDFPEDAPVTAIYDSGSAEGTVVAAARDDGGVALIVE